MLVRKRLATPLLLSLLLQLQLLQEQCKKKKSSTTTVQEQIAPPCRCPQLGVGGGLGEQTQRYETASVQCPIPHISFCPASRNGQKGVSRSESGTVCCCCMHQLAACEMPREFSKGLCVNKHVLIQAYTALRCCLPAF